MIYENTKSKGDLAEIQFIALLMRNGYKVSIPFGENGPYDVVTESPTGKLYRVQVRWCSWHSGRIDVRLRVVSKNYSRTIDMARIDTFAVYDGTDFYIIPTEDLKHCTAVFSLRDAPPANNQKKNVTFASEYRNKLGFMP
jgi:hypothetical protein